MTTTPSLERAAHRTLRRLGFRRFRAKQLRIILAILSFRDVLAILGTSRGKSICWWIPALIWRGVTVVVTPHISQMEEQVALFNDRIPGELAAFLNGNLTPDQRATVLDSLRLGRVRLLYLAPEALAARPLRALLRRVGVSLLVVDEAHCVVADSSYRTDYWWLGTYARDIDVRQIACFSATVPKGFVQSTITRLLGLDDPEVVRGNLHRPNHYYLTLRCDSNPARFAVLGDLLEQLRDRGADRGIVYCARKLDVPVLLWWLHRSGFRGVSYVGSPSTRAHRQRNRRNQELFRSGQRRILVATKAFELGIDVPDVRFVISFNLPSSLLSMFQMFGRSGRDGKPAYCIQLSAPQDHALQRAFLSGNLDDLKAHRGELPRHLRRQIYLPEWREYLRFERRAVRDMVHQSGGCQRFGLIRHLDQLLLRRPHRCCLRCDKCRNPNIHP